MGDQVGVSFCATNLNTSDRIEASLASVERLGTLIGRPYEIVVADGPSTDGARELLTRRAANDSRLRLVPHDQRSRGHGRRLAFEASSGRTIVPFDTSIQYAPEYGPLLAAYVRLDTERMLFSEVCALSRATIESVGGWRDLVGGEDVDLYARVIQRFGIIAYPTALPGSQSEAIGAYARQMRYVGGGRYQRFRRILAVQRDQIIAANYRVADLMAFNAKKPWGRRALYRAFFTLAWTSSRFRDLKPFVFDRSNYLLIREETLRSMLEGRQKLLRWDGPPPRLLLTEDEETFLERRSGLWAAEAPRLQMLVGRKGGRIANNSPGPAPPRENSG
jgi:glycosyltransferase involved in cell wall biosynthesis